MADTPIQDRDPPLAAAISLLGGAALMRTRDALRRVGMPLSHESICIRRRRGTLPVRETRLGSVYYVTAAAVADAFFRSAPVAQAPQDQAQHVRRTASRRGPGRPRKVAGAAE